jgi:zinc transporter
MSEEDGLLHAYVLNSGGPAEARDWTTLAEPVPAKGYVWLHLDRSVEQSQSWLIEQSGLDPVVSEALLAPETRPRSTRFETGVLVILRAVNLNPGADPEDMVSLRIWIEPKRIISLRSRRVMAVGDLLARIERGQAPKSPTGLLILLADRVAAHIEPVIAEIEDALDDLEEQTATEEASDLRERNGALRRQASQLRRFIGPQRDALLHLAVENVSWITNADRQHLRETADDITRFVEALNATWERAAVMNDELTSRLAEHTNRRLYVLSIVAVVFLPLSFVTGLLGMNIGGIPGAQTGLGFAITVALLALLAGIELWVLRRFGLL